MTSAQKERLRLHARRERARRRRARPGTQLELGMPETFAWGGRRDGAGRRPGERPLTPHAPREIIQARFPLLLTLRFAADLPLLAGPVFFDVLLWALERTTGTNGTRFCGYTAQLDHAHLLGETQSAQHLSRAMIALGGRMGAAMNEILGRRAPLLAGRFHARVLRTPGEVRSAVIYVAENTLHHAARAGRWLDPARPDPFTSLGRIPLGQHRPLGARALGPVVTSAPETWLLAAGWHLA